MGRKGKPPKFVRDEDGREVFGLSQNPIRNKAKEIVGYRYYATFSKPRKWFGSHKAQAIFEFHAWQAKQKGEVVAFREPLQDIVKLEQALLAEKRITITTKVAGGEQRLEEVYHEAEVPADVVWRTVAEAIRNDKALAARKLGIPQIAWITDLEKPVDALMFDEIIDLYCQKGFSDPNEAKRSRLYWSEFVKAVSPCRTLRELTKPHLVRYLNGVKTAGFGARTMRNRLLKIPTILNYVQAVTDGHDEDFNLARKYYADVVYDRMPDAPIPIPAPIPRQDFARLLKGASVKWKAILLFSLNAALKVGDICKSAKATIDFEQKYLWDRRAKNKHPRVAMLWDRTLRAIRAYVKENARNSHYQTGRLLFVNGDGNPYTSQELCWEFAELRASCGISPEIKFDMIRDGAQHAAQKKANPIHVEMLMGHSLPKVMSHYEPYIPESTAVACGAIESFYFG